MSPALAGRFFNTSTTNSTTASTGTANVPKQHSKKTKVSCSLFLWKFTNWANKKDLHNPDNHDGVITHLQPDILECEVKWALESITTNKASGGDRIPVELFQILKDDAVKVLNSIWQQIWKTQQRPQDWKRSVFIQSQRKAIPKNAQIITQLHSSHTPVKRCSKFSKPDFSSTWTKNFQMFKLVLEKAEEPEIKLPTSTGS